jgi:hypothetical protein
LASGAAVARAAGQHHRAGARVPSQLDAQGQPSHSRLAALAGVAISTPNFCACT